MRTSPFSTRIAVGLISSAAAAALLAPAASGATPSGTIALTATPATSTAVQRPAALLSAPGQQFVVVHTVPVGTAGPAAPAPVVLTVDKSTNKVTVDKSTNKVAVDKSTNRVELPGAIAPQDLGRVPVAKRGYINEQEAAWQGAAAGAGQGAAIGAIAGAIVGAIFGLPFLIVGAIPGAISGAITGAVWGAVGGAVSGYINGQNQARAHNNAVRKNGGKPVAARVPPRATASAPKPVRELRELPEVKLPPQAHRTIDDAKRAFARAFGIPTPR